MAFAQINAFTVPNDSGTGSLTVNLPDGVTIPAGFNSGGAFILILTLLTFLVKKVPIIKTRLDQLLPKQKDAATISIVYVSAIAAGGVSLLLQKYCGVPSPITPNQLIVSALGFGTFAIGTHSIIMKVIWQGIIKSYLNSKEVDSMTMKSTMKSMLVPLLIMTMVCLSMFEQVFAQPAVQYKSTYGYTTALSGQVKQVATNNAGTVSVFKGITIWSSSSTVNITVYDAASYSQATGLGKYLIPTSTVSTQQISKEQGITIYSDKLGLTDAECEKGILVFISGGVDVKYNVLWRNKL